MERAAISIGTGGQGGGAHTAQEWYQPEGREVGLRRILLLVAALSAQAVVRDSNETAQAANRESVVRDSTASAQAVVRDSMQTAQAANRESGVRDSIESATETGESPAETA